MKDGLYHTEIGLPEAPLARWVGKTFKLRYSHHAMQAAFSDRYGRVTKAPRELLLRREDIFEVELWRDCVVKIVVRLGSGFEASRPGLDLVLALSEISPGVLHVRTLWFNEQTDAHKTLDRSKYECVS